VLFDKIASLYILFKKYIYILALKMASPANCIGTLSLPMRVICSNCGEEWKNCFHLLGV